MAKLPDRWSPDLGINYDTYIDLKEAEDAKINYSTDFGSISNNNTNGFGDTISSISDISKRNYFNMKDSNSSLGYKSNDNTPKAKSGGANWGAIGAITGAISNSMPNWYQTQYQDQDPQVLDAVYGDSTQDPIARLIMGHGDAMSGVLGNINNSITDYSGVRNNTNLYNAYKNNNRQDVNYKFGWSNIADNLNASATGASYGAQFGGPWGALIGGIIGGVANIGSQIGGGKRAQLINDANQIAYNREQSSFQNRQMNNDMLNLRNNLYNIMADGGYMSVDNGVTEFNEGGSHQSNPYGGIKQGIASDNIPNLVEQGEVKWNDYIFSARNKPSKSLLKKYLLDEKYFGKSFADIAKKYQEYSKDRPNDNIAISTLDTMLERLENAQEEYNRSKEERRLAKIYDSLPVKQKAQLANEYQNTVDPLQYADGGEIFIKPENRGKFTALKERTGHSATWFKEHGTQAQKKMAALNSRKWNHTNGGHLFADGGPDDGDILEGTKRIYPYYIIDKMPIYNPNLNPKLEPAHHHDIDDNFENIINSLIYEDVPPYGNYVYNYNAVQPYSYGKPTPWDDWNSAIGRGITFMHPYDSALEPYTNDGDHNYRRAVLSRRYMSPYEYENSDWNGKIAPRPQSSNASYLRPIPEEQEIPNDNITPSEMFKDQDDLTAYYRQRYSDYLRSKNKNITDEQIKKKALNNAEAKEFFDYLRNTNNTRDIALSNLLSSTLDLSNNGIKETEEYLNRAKKERADNPKSYDGKIGIEHAPFYDSPDVKPSDVVDKDSPVINKPKDVDGNIDNQTQLHPNQTNQNQTNPNNNIIADNILRKASLFSSLGAFMTPTDYTYANDLYRLAGEYNPIAAPILGGYLPYDPYDVNLTNNQNMAQYAALQRSNRENVNRASQAAANIGAYNAYANQVAFNNFEWQKANAADRLAKSTYNLDIDKENLNNTKAYDALNLQQNDKRVNMLASAAAAKDQATTLSSTNRSQALTNLFNNIGALGKEKLQMALVNKAIEDGVLQGNAPQLQGFWDYISSLKS